MEIGRALILFVFSAFTTAAFAKPLALSEALRHAVQNAPEFDAVVQSAAQSELIYKNARAQFWPQLGIEAAHGYYDHSGLTDSTLPAHPWADRLSLNLTEKLYDNGQSWRALRSADLARQAASLTKRRGLLSLYLQVADAFYDYSSAVNASRIQEQQIDSLRQQFRSIESRYHQGVSSDRDFLRIKAQLQSAEVDLASSKLSITDRLKKLRLVVGDRGALNFTPVIPDEQKIQAMKFPKVDPEITLDFQVAKLKDRIAKIKYRNAVREYWPRISLKGSYSYNQPQYLGAKTAGLDDPYWDLQAALTIDYSLWDWGQKRRDIEIADSQKHIDDDQQDSIRIQVRQDLNHLKKQTELLRESYRATRQILKDNKAVYASLNRGYKDGNVTYLELITALSSLYSSRLSFLNLKFELLKARANLAFYQGNLDDVLSSN